MKREKDNAMRTQLGSVSCRSLCGILLVGIFFILAPTAHATTYYSNYGQSRTWYINLTSSGTHKFIVDKIARYRLTE
ncbi:MAG: hypothetical protein ACE5JP_16245, partial [Candidatus Bipolaricaulia bacterium]